MEEIRLLSLVIPSYNQEKMIGKNIVSLNTVLSALPFKHEIIVVFDGINKKSLTKLKKLENKNIRIYGYLDNRGKGYAVRYGLLRAKGDIVGFIDAGMDIDPTGVSMLLNHMVWYNADIIIGSKLHPVSQVNYPNIRKVLSWGYRTFTHILFGFKVKDTQVGLKIFRKKVVDDVFPRLIVNDFAFDIEVLAVAYALGYKRIYEAPVKLHFKNVSSITSKRYLEIIAYMIYNTLGVFYRLHITHFYKYKRKYKRLRP